MLCMQLFGKFSVRHNGQELDGFEARKMQELRQAMLASTGPHQALEELYQGAIYHNVYRLSQFAYHDRLR